MTDNLGYGKERRRQGNLDILTGKATFRCARQKTSNRIDLRTHFRDAFREMLSSIVANGHSFEECKDVFAQESVTVYCSTPNE